MYKSCSKFNMYKIMEIEKYKTIFDYCTKIFANIKKFLKKYHKLIKINKSSQTD